MPKPNFYMSERDRLTLLHLISNYQGMWMDVDQDVMDERSEEFKEINRVGDKIKNMKKSKGYNNAVVADALEIADRLKKESKI